jgi:hypothetical protein
MDINDQLSKIINKIKDKKEILKGLKNQYNLMFIMRTIATFSWPASVPGNGSWNR